MSAAAGPVRLAVAGIGGYAREITNLVLADGGDTSPPAQLAAVCDPALAAHADRVAELRGRGVELFDSYEAMIDAAPRVGVEGVWLPVPIPLHLPFTEKALAAGLPVMVEKPVAGCIDDVDRMIALERRYKLPVAVGFQDVYDRDTLPLKRRILAGDFGRITDATLHALWPRSDAYFNRAGWAGRLKVGDTWVLDSPANNALAHFVNIVLFLLGPTEAESAQPQRLEVELYRAAAIENYDTISCRVHLAGGVRFLILLTHACIQGLNPIVTLHGERGLVRRTNSDLTVTLGEHTETTQRDPHMRRDMLGRFARLVRGIDDRDTAVATLASARPHAAIVSAASQATPVVEVPEAAVETASRDGGVIRGIRGIGAIFDACVAKTQLLHESRLLPFTRPPGIIELAGYSRFAGPPAAHHAAPVAASIH